MSANRVEAVVADDDANSRIRIQGGGLEYRQPVEDTGGFDFANLAVKRASQLLIVHHLITRGFDTPLADSQSWMKCNASFIECPAENA